MNGLTPWGPIGHVTVVVALTIFSKNVLRDHGVEEEVTLQQNQVTTASQEGERIGVIEAGARLEERAILEEIRRAANVSTANLYTTRLLTALMQRKTIVETVELKATQQRNAGTKTLKGLNIVNIVKSKAIPQRNAGIKILKKDLKTKTKKQPTYPT